MAEKYIETEIAAIYRYELFFNHITFSKELIINHDIPDAKAAKYLGPLCRKEIR